VSHGFDPDSFWDITTREANLRIEAVAKRWEREHNGRVWLAWHTAALQRTKRLPDIRKMFLNNTSKTRQTWRQQLAIVSEWATRHNRLESIKEKARGR
jgi:hypothetical protein